MKHLLLTTIAGVVLATTAFADPIHDAASNNDLAGVQAELDNGADVNAKDGVGWTPLHYATDREIAELLIANGANVNAKDGDGETPLDLTNTEIADLLREHGGKTGEELTPEATSPTAKAPDISIHDAARAGNIEAVKQHLAAGTDVNAKDDEIGGTPLHYATRADHKEVVELLIANSADVNAKDDRFGWTPLHSAAKGAHKEIYELLIAKGADVNAKNASGRTPPDLAPYASDLWKSTKPKSPTKSKPGNTNKNNDSWYDRWYIEIWATLASLVIVWLFSGGTSRPRVVGVVTRSTDDDCDCDDFGGMM